MNIGPDGAELPEGNGPFLPLGLTGVLACLPFAVWLFLAIEQLPLAAEESLDPQRDMPQGHHRRHVHADRLRVPDPLAEPRRSRASAPTRSASRASRCSTASARSSAASIAKLLALVAVVGLIASFHTIIFAKGRQIYSLEPRRLLPDRPLGHPRHAARRRTSR